MKHVFWVGKSGFAKQRATCALCGFEYSEEESMKACSGCPMSGGKCRLLKCPNCGYETPAESKLIKLIKKWGRKSGNAT